MEEGEDAKRAKIFSTVLLRNDVACGAVAYQNKRS
jgi:hypothetical protein